MLKFLRCLFVGHEWDLISKSSHKRVLKALKVENDSVERDMLKGLLGYKEYVMKCKKCSRFDIKQTLGE
jgi:hypothetical protein